MYFGIEKSTEWLSATPLNKGWSSDRKYIVETLHGEKLLLRLSDVSLFDEKAREFAVMEKFLKAGINMSVPLGFGKADNGKSVYILLTWVEGEDLEAALPRLDSASQKRAGEEAGSILKKIHSIPLDAHDATAQTKVPKKLKQLDDYMHSSVRIDDDGHVIRFITDNIDSIWKEKPAYLHGDYHPGNLIYTPEGTIGVIDFNRWEVGDPFEEFYKLQSFGIESSKLYCASQIDSYFGTEPPEAFWRALAVYSAHSSLFSIKWAEKFGRQEVEGMVRRCRTAINDYDGFTRLIPKWYEEVKNAKTVSI